MSYIDDLVAALKEEFAGEVVFQANLPSSVSAPAVVVTPGDPFIEPREAASSIVRETWDVLVAVSIKDTGIGLAQMRELSLRVRKVANASGAVWRQASGPRRLGDVSTQTQVVVSVNQVHFRYDANAITT